MIVYYHNDHNHCTKMYMYIHQVTFFHKECVTFFVLLDFFKNDFFRTCEVLFTCKGVLICLSGSRETHLYITGPVRLDEGQTKGLKFSAPHKCRLAHNLDKVTLTMNFMTV